MGVSEEIDGDANRNSRGDTMQMLRKQDHKSVSEIIKELAKNNSMLLDEIAKAKDEVGFSREASRISKGSIGASGECSSEDRRGENRQQERGQGIKTRREYESATDEEYDPKYKSMMRKKRIARNEDSDTEKEKKETDYIRKRASCGSRERANYAVKVARRESRRKSVAERTDDAAKSRKRATNRRRT